LSLILPKLDLLKGKEAIPKCIKYSSYKSGTLHHYYIKKYAYNCILITYK